MHGCRHALTQGLQSRDQGPTLINGFSEETTRPDLRLPEALGRQNEDRRAAGSPSLTVDFRGHGSQEATWNDTCWAKSPLGAVQLVEKNFK